VLLPGLLAEEKEAEKNASLVVTDQDRSPAPFKDVRLTSYPTSSDRVSSTTGRVDDDVPASTVNGID